MKLLNCRIENFGNLTGAEYNFDSGLNVFCEENGYGKTTLASFIKAMFYGLPSVRSNTKDFNDRKRFYPFNGGKFGGSITFTTGGKEYRIERFFGKKSDTDDELSVYCNNSPCSDFGGDIGRAVFGLDKDSFERTTFLNCDTDDICATNGISAKLNNFVQNAEEGNMFDVSLAKLEKAKKELKASRGNNDLISRKKQEVSDLKFSISNLEKIAGTLGDYYAEEGRLKREIEEKEAEIQKIRDNNLLVERWEQYENLASKLAGEEKALLQIDGKYTSGLPAESEVAELKRANSRKILLAGTSEATEFSYEKREKLDGLLKVFSKGVPDEAYLKKLQDNVDEIKRLDVKISALPSEHKSGREPELERKFAGKIPPDSEVQKIGEKVEIYRTADARLKAHADVAPSKKRGGLYAILAVIAGLVCIAGGITLFFNAVAGGVLVGAGVIGLGAVGFLYLKKSPAVSDGGVADIKAEMSGAESAVREFLVPYGYYSQNGVVYDFACFKDDIKEYSQSLQEFSERAERLKELQAERESLILNVKEELAGYGYCDGDLQSALQRLITAVNEYFSLLEEREKVTREKGRIEGEIAEINGRIKACLEKYGIAVSDNIAGQLEEISLNISERERLVNSVKRNRAEAEEYREKYSLSQRPEEEKRDAEGLKTELTALRRTLAVKEEQIADAERDSETLDERKSRLKEEEETLEDLKYKLKIVNAVIDCLQTADRNLKEKYVAPVRDKFLKYANLLEETLGEKVSMDRDFNLLFERCGEMRNDRHLSAGQRSICSLCLRIALAENMYGGEKPFFIMDDPFVHLDEEHMERTEKTVKALSQDFQIVYFCCHESRKFNI